MFKGSSLRLKKRGILYKQGFINHQLFPGPSPPPLTVHDMRNGAVLIEVDVESLGLEVLCDHHARLDDTGFLGEVPLREGLELSVFISQVAAC